MSTTIAETAGRFVAGLELEDVPDDVVETARIAVVHNLSVAAAGSRLVPVVDRWSRQRWGGYGARSFVTGLELSPPDAAFVNACRVHARAQDDTYFPGLTHVGAATLPAVVALAEAKGASLGDVLVALIAGYEVAGAVSVASAPVTTSFGFRASGIYGVFGAAAGAARMLRLDRQQASDAVAIASSFASGTNQTWVDGSTEWQLQLGAASRAGLEAAAAATSGARGAAGAFEGSSGFYQAFAREAGLAEGVAADLGTAWRTRAVTFKSHPVCAILQSPVDAAVQLNSLGRPGAVARAELRLTPAEAHYPGTEGTPPFKDAGAALMSASYCVALALLQGSVTADDLFRSDEERLQQLSERIAVVADPDLGPRRFVLEVEWTDGQVDRIESDGSDAGPWSRAQLLGNVDRLASEVPPGIELDRLVDTVFGDLAAPASTLVDAVVMP